ncbi:MAG: hypothetical protein DCF15_03325 [Phormidesmis priestleyi]|uniref:MobA-like NTP transferase domain-containing protein n=1 Tax=Phormidesmis priestleyi TaxID=268141 RepID=A0A2W4XQB4_9CYAN|nr:MAG: hypothetical protein DCF15_03325 [Phormidesmis priestleyi]
MKIIIPMSGFGERFRRAGYTVPKPLIPLNGKPIIGHVIDMFSQEDEFVFICNQDHIQKFPVVDTLKRYCPDGRVLGIPSHKKGPVYAVIQALDYIDDDEPVIVNYCDFSCYWDYTHFKYWLELSGSDGCVPAYRNFHPHSLHGANYAFIQEKDGWMMQIQEKSPFTANKIAEFASSGTYYFAKGSYIKQFFQAAIDNNVLVNNEYYCSVIYNLMIQAGLKVSVYDLEHFMQWGTPKDLEEFRRWFDLFVRLNHIEQQTEQQTLPGVTLIPLAGRGSRFRQEGYQLPKPLISVSAEPMVVQAVRSLPRTQNYHFVCLEEHLGNSNLKQSLTESFSDADSKVGISGLRDVTDGQARTCVAAMAHIDSRQPLTISACDHAVLFDRDRFNQLWYDTHVDCIVWVAREHPGAVRYPEMYGWVEEENGSITQVSVKQPLQNPEHDPIIIGTFTFKETQIFQLAFERMVERQGMVNGEYYVDTCINDAIALGYKCVIFEVDHYICWGTPNDLKTFEYWQSCFHKWQSHPYRIENDSWIPKSKRRLISQQTSPKLSALPLA